LFQVTLCKLGKELPEKKSLPTSSAAVSRSLFGHPHVAALFSGSGSQEELIARES